MTPNIAIMVVAENIGQAIVDRFVECVHLSQPHANIHVEILKSETPQGIFCKSKILNAGIKKLVKGNYDLIIQADIDVIVPPRLIEATYAVGSRPNTCFHCDHRRVDPHKLPKLPEKYATLDFDSLREVFPIEESAGCWNGMTPDNWWKSGGYNELMEGWGKEDNAFRRSVERNTRIRFVDDNSHVLFHINHPRRTPDHRARNKRIELTCEREGRWNFLEEKNTK